MARRTKPAVATKKKPSLSKQMKKRGKQPVKKVEKKKWEGNTEVMVSSGSTLLNLAATGGRVYGGGFPGGIIIIAYGPSGSGKTVLACEFAGAIQRGGGEIHYKDSEARLNKDFSETFDLVYDDINYDRPNTIPEAFLPLHKWEPDTSVINGYVIDSLAALSTDMEMGKDEGDKMGQRRAKEFSEHLRKGARGITNKNLIVFATNQIREKTNAQKFERKDINPGGKAIEFYSSLVLRFSTFQKIKKVVKIKGKDETRVIGIEGTLEVVKSSIWKPYREAPITIFFDYGIDNIRENLKYVKRYAGTSTYTCNKINLGKSLDEAIEKVEEQSLEKKLEKQVIKLWEDVEAKFTINRKKKVR